MAGIRFAFGTRWILIVSNYPLGSWAPSANFESERLHLVFTNLVCTRKIVRIAVMVLVVKPYDKNLVTKILI